MPRRWVRVSLFALLVVSPLPFGSVEAGWVLVIQLYAAALGAAAVAILARDPDGLPRPARVLLVPATIVAAVGAIQLLPLPPGLVRIASPASAGTREAISALLPGAGAAAAPLSLSPPATADALLRLVAYVLIGLAAAVSIRRRSHLRQLAFAVALCGAFQALYGAAEFLSGRQHIFFYAKQHFLDDATGTFINRNHFAGYLAMTLPVALALVLAGRGRAGPAMSWRRRLVALTEPAGLPLLAAGFAAFLIWDGIFLSSSRAGLLCALFATSLLAAIAARGRWRIRGLAVCLIVATLAVGVLQVAAPGERFLRVGTDLAAASSRIGVWHSTVGIVRDLPLTGSGLGTFRAALPLYQQGDLGGSFRHAHNDWLQVAAEGGLVSLLAAAFALAVVVHGGWRRHWREGRDLLGASILAAIVTISLHGLLDFCLRIPAIAVLLAVLVGSHAAAVSMPAPPLPTPLRKGR